MNRKKNISREIVVSAEGWIYLIILSFIAVGAVLRNVNLLILMSGMMIAPLLVNWRLGVLWVNNIVARRTVPNRLHARQLASVQWLCYNRSSISAWGVEVIDSVHASDEGQSNAVGDVADLEDSNTQNTNVISPWKRLRMAISRSFSNKAGLTHPSNIRLEFPAVSSRKNEVMGCRLYVPRRGIYQFGPAVVLTRFPFGLITVRIKIDNPETVFVAPQLGNLTPVWDRRIRSIMTGQDAVLRKRGLSGEDFFSLREWRAGDSRKLIHWRTSARHGSPVVKQLEQPDNRDFAMLLDLYDADADANSQSGSRVDSANCETVLSFAATVVLQINSAIQGRVAIAVCGEKTTVFESKTLRDLVDQTMRRLAVVQPSQQPKLAPALIRLADSVSNSTPIFVFSTRSRPDELMEYSDEATVEDDSVNNSTGLVERARLRSILQNLVWISVDSSEFKSLFDPNVQDKELQALTEKWNQYVPN